jgi:hypothetical protein
MEGKKRKEKRIQTSAARAAAERASELPPVLVRSARRGVLLVVVDVVVGFGVLAGFFAVWGTDARVGCCGGAPRTRPGWEKGSAGFEDLEQMFPMAGGGYGMTKLAWVVLLS